MKYIQNKEERGWQCIHPITEVKLGEDVYYISKIEFSK